VQERKATAWVPEAVSRDDLTEQLLEGGGGGDEDASDSIVVLLLMMVVLVSMLDDGRGLYRLTNGYLTTTTTTVSFALSILGGAKEEMMTTKMVTFWSPSVSVCLHPQQNLSSAAAMPLQNSWGLSCALGSIRVSTGAGPDFLCSMSGRPLPFGPRA